MGIYPAGAAPGGHQDMAGNVWEWVWHDHIFGAERRIRGGGKSDSADDWHPVICSDYLARYRYCGLGFLPLQVGTIGPCSLGLAVWSFAVDRLKQPRQYVNV